MVEPNWVDINTYGKEGELTLSLSDRGCGCCCEGTSTEDVDKAIDLMTEHITDLQNALASKYAWLQRVKETRVIQEIK